MHRDQRRPRAAAALADPAMTGVIGSASTICSMPVTIANACALIMASEVQVMKWRFRDGDPNS